MDTKFCIDAEYLDSVIFLGFVRGWASYDKLTTEQLGAFLEGKETESKTSVTLDRLDVLVQSTFRMDMNDRNMN